MNIDCKSDIKKAVGKIKNSLLNTQTMGNIEFEKNILSMMAMEKEFVKIQNDIIIQQLYQLSNPNTTGSRLQDQNQQKLL